MRLYSHSHNQLGRLVQDRFSKEGICYANPSLLLVFCLVVLLVACQGRGESEFSGAKAYEHVVVQVAFGPRPVGSEAVARTGDYIEAYLKSQGWRTWQEVTYFRDTLVRNLLAQKDVSDTDALPLIMLGAHYDTRPYADRDPNAKNRTQPLLGANDGASGVAVLLELARVYDPAKSRANVVLAFFDGEDKGNIDGWPFSVGADAVADEWAGKLAAMILVDMVGDADQQLYFEGLSDSALSSQIWGVAAQMGYSEWFVPQTRYSITDDHVPFIERGVSSVNIIDFDYPYWHTMADTTDKIGARSLGRVGRVLLGYLYSK